MHRIAIATALGPAIGLLAQVSTAEAAPGDHIRAGDVGVIPKVDLGAEVRTNVYRNEITSVPAANFRIAPGLLLIAAGDDHEFRTDGEWVLRKFFYVADDELLSAASVPSPERIGTLDRFDEYSLSLGMNTFKRNVVGFKLSDDSALVNNRADAEFADVPYTSQLRNTLAGGLRINPGEALEITPGGAWTYDSFRAPSSDDRPDRALNTRNSYGPTLGVKWAFLPRTSLVAGASWMSVNWQENRLEASPGEYGSDIVLPNADYVKAHAGLDGRFTEKIFAQLVLGYGVGLYDVRSIDGLEDANTVADIDATGVDGLLVKSQIRYSITPSDERRQGTSIAAGYVRDFRSAFFTNFVQFDELFADFQGRLGDLTPSVRYEIRFEDYEGDVIRHDIVNRVSADLKYGASDWMAFTAGGWWQQRASDLDTVEYDDVNVHLLATFMY